MYKCSCNININPLKFPNHLKSRRHKYFYYKNHHPFFIKSLNTSKRELNNININELL